MNSRGSIPAGQGRHEPYPNKFQQRRLSKKERQRIFVSKKAKKTHKQQKLLRRLKKDEHENN
jgi:hypothetical protein